MRRSNLMLVVATLGLALGLPLALKGWEGLRGVVIFLDAQSPRLLGSILVALSIAVLIRQARSRPITSSQPPKASPSSDAAPREGGSISHPEPPPLDR